jgi:hypothetical protein
VTLALPSVRYLAGDEWIIDTKSEHRLKLECSSVRMTQVLFFRPGVIIKEPGMTRTRKAGR